MIKHINKALCMALALLSFNATAGDTQTAFRFAAGITQKDYLPNTLIIKVLPAYRAQCSNNAIELLSLQKIFTAMEVANLYKIFPLHQPPAEPFDQYGRAYVDLSLIYQVEYKATGDMAKIINRLVATNVLEYAEPKYLPTTQYHPNDPSIGNQNFLTRIQAEAGWDISKGDTNVVIGIDDTGSDLDHPDLAANLKHNYADPIDGIDNDGDGYIDNFDGWDLGENDNDPTVNVNNHGSHVSGCAAAVSDNGVGVASSGYNCKFLTIKISNAGGSLTKAYEGIAYAADHGCDIINCSWGGGGGGTFGENIINYATINKDALVVVAAGNNNSNQLFFPAAYPNALSIAATNSANDFKASFSNYGTFIDVCSPGNNIYATIYNNSYQYESGTSMAAPVAAGCAAIIKSYFPTYNALQVGEQLRITADNIYNLAPNAGFLATRGLGTGRINLFKALTVSSPSVRINPLNITDNNDNIYIINDTLYITGNITNYLAATTNLDVTLTTTSTFVTIVDGITTVGALATMATTNNNTDPFTIAINTNAPQNSVIQFKLTFTDGAYTDYQTFDITVNVDYLNITINDVHTTNTSKGRLCYNADTQTQGLGFNFNGLGTLAYETGLMIGNNNNVSDGVRASGATPDNDFVPVNVIQKNDPPVWSDFDTYGKFDDSQAATPLNITVNHRSLSWSLAPNSRYHIFEYTIHNNGSSALSSLYAGIFSDWDIMDYSHNKGDEVAAEKMGYVYSTDSAGLYAGIKVLTSGAWNHYAIDNVAGGGGGLDVSGGFTSAQKYTALSTNRATAGGTGVGNDIIDVVSNGAFSLNAGDSIKVAFALIAGESLSDIIASAQAAQQGYNVITGVSEITSSNGVTVTTVYPNPANDKAGFNLNLNQSQEVEITVYDMLGNKISTVAKGTQAAGNNHFTFSVKGWSKGMYMLHVSGKDAQLNTRFIAGE